MIKYGKHMRRESSEQPSFPTAEWYPEYWPSRLNFDRIHPEVISRYGQELPRPASKMEISTVVNAYNEVDNDNFWRMLRSAAAQFAAKPAWEIVYVVNNPIADANNQSSAYQDNQRALTIIRILNEAKVKFESGSSYDSVAREYSEKIKQLGYSADEQEIFKLAIREKVNMVGVDVSSPAKALDLDYASNGREINPRGLAKDIGVHVAVERLRHTVGETRGLVDFLDADCVIPPDYYDQIKRSVGRGSFFIKQLIPFISELPEYIWNEKNDIQCLINFIMLLRGQYHNRSLRYFNSVEGTPSHLARAEAIHNSGGYHVYGSDEDAWFYSHMRELYKPLALTTVYVRLGDRNRAGSVDGAENYFTASSNYLIKFFRDEMGPNPIKSEAAHLLDERFAEVMFEKNRLHEADELYRDLRRSWYQRELGYRRRCLTGHTRTVKEICGEIKPLTSGQVFDNSLDYMNNTPGIRRVVNIIRNLISDERKSKSLAIPNFNGKTESERVMQFLEYYIPDEFADAPDDEPSYTLDAIRTQPVRNFLQIFRAAFYF